MSDRLLNPSTKISPSRFRQAFNRFQAIHIKREGRALESFSDRKSFVYDGEGYKNSIPNRAMAILEAHRWSQSQIGQGEILTHVINAIEISGNNLLQWQGRQGPKSRVHQRLMEAKSDPKAVRELENLFYDLYKKKRADKGTFEGLVRLCGKRYELLGYLFFIAAPDDYLPLRTRSFDKALSELGLDLRTEGQCGWENYQAFIAAIREVQTRLRAEGIADTSLLDAHSFCWILARYNEVDESDLEAGPIEMWLFEGILHEAPKDAEFSPNDDAKRRDMQQEAKRRVASGQIAEETALREEKNRLCREGRPDLAARVETVSDRPGVGCDIKSFDHDGSTRFIEVKNVSNGHRFFLSDNEWKNSRNRPNYWFYLVSQSRITCLASSELEEAHLRPMDYVVEFSPR